MIDRFVVLGTTSLDRDLGALLQNQPFVYVLSEPGSGEQNQLPELEEWTMSNLVFQITLP